MLREIVFDTETTGFDPHQGDKLVEIGAIELINHIPTGRTYHQYINPLRDMPEEAFKVHGLSTEFLQNYPRFSEIAKDFLNFVGDDGIMVAHNAQFDMNFVNYELKHNGFDTLKDHEVVDTLEIAKAKFPSARNNLDALCKRFNIDNSKRTKHGALLDAELLAEVYLELLGGAEPTMNLNTEEKVVTTADNQNTHEKKYLKPRDFKLTEEDEKNHEAFLNQKIKEALWLKS
ncbi:MAG: DNA polymerase III subunit epsilon [Alphaproteobacteria bacterium]|nr:DNA polymerase III subunit epsilon [Alphaproteobacteria bacterium]